MIIFDFNINILSIHLPRGLGQNIFQLSCTTRRHLQQGIENSQNIHEKNGFDHNFNIVLSIFNIKKAILCSFYEDTQEHAPRAI